MRRRTWVSALVIVAALLALAGAGLVADMTDLGSATSASDAGRAVPLRDRLTGVADRSVVRLTHYGRKTGTPYEVTTWFAVDGETVYLPTSDRGRQWARNVLHTPRVGLQIGAQQFDGSIKPVTDDAEKHRVYGLLRDKYWTIWLIAQVAPLLGRDPDNEEMDLGRGGFYRVDLTAG